ncbi:LysE family translocator [Pseudonocardia eucalypti]|uniref:LysE family translocator n=1 Tax=Pseudonocardia eucalypti TaxID=648755 RepID=A0ABP9QQ08_9PSEU
MDNLLAFAVASVVLVLIPGPSVLFVVSRAIAHGRRAALGSVVGNSAGVCVVILLVAFGLGSLVERSVLLFTAIKLAGAAYLVYLGVRTFRERGRLSEAIGAGIGGAAPAGVAGHVFRQGFVVGLTNPKTLVFFGAVLPQFVDREAGGVPVQMVVLGLTFVLAALVLDSLWGIMAGTARTWLARSPRRLAVLGGTGGLTMIGLGVGLAVTGRAER